MRHFILEHNLAGDFHAREIATCDDRQLVEVENEPLTRWLARHYGITELRLYRLHDQPLPRTIEHHINNMVAGAG